MPTARKPSDRDRELEAALQARDQFAAGFKRSKKGNLWRNYEGLTVVIFRRQGDDWFSWSITDTDDEGPRFSPRPFDTEADAMDALCDELLIGEF